MHFIKKCAIAAAALAGGAEAADKNILMLFGPPGAGKGTVAPEIVAKFQIPQLSTGDMLRLAEEAGTEAGLQAAEFSGRGELAPDPIVIEIIKERIEKPDCKAGFILDGFPRTVEQAKALDTMLATTNDKVTAVVELKCTEDELYRRIAGRWIHNGSGRSYNSKKAKHMPESYRQALKADPNAEPSEANMLDDETNEPLKQRPDDTPEKLKKRLESYSAKTFPVLGQYPGIHKQIDAERADFKTETLATIAAAFYGNEGSIFRKQFRADPIGSFRSILRQQQVEAVLDAEEKNVVPGWAIFLMVVLALVAIGASASLVHTKFGQHKNNKAEEALVHDADENPQDLERGAERV